MLCNASRHRHVCAQTSSRTLFSGCVSAKSMKSHTVRLNSRPMTARELEHIAVFPYTNCSRVKFPVATAWTVQERGCARRWTPWCTCQSTKLWLHPLQSRSPGQVMSACLDHFLSVKSVRMLSNADALGITNPFNSLLQLSHTGVLAYMGVFLAGERPACRVWDRSDLLRRLQSYKASTWFCKPPGAAPLDCARRGWINTSLDMLTCEVTPTPGFMRPSLHCTSTHGNHVVSHGTILYSQWSASALSSPCIPSSHVNQECVMVGPCQSGMH